MQNLLAALVSFWALFTPLNVMNYGATGNGITDDTNAVNAALAAAHTAGKSLYFPPGTYLCNQHDTTGRILYFNDGGLSNVTLYGNGATILTSDTGLAGHGSNLLYVYAFAPGNGLVIDGLRFVSTHGRTNNQTTGLFMTGTNGTDITNTYLENCAFSGFGYDVEGQGINGWTIKYDSFYAPNGHDDAYYGSNSGNPAVNMWLFDNTNGSCFNVLVSKCWASGYTGTIPMAARRPMDGFIYGYAYGLSCNANTTVGFCQEHYGILPPTTTPATTAQVLIQNDSIICTLPAGITDDNGNLHKYNYGIRCDASHATISNNTLITPSWGIMQRGVDYSSFTPTDLQITGNNITIPQDTNTVIYQGAIYINAASARPVSLVNIQNNIIAGIDTIPIQTFNLTSPVTTPNYWSPIQLR